MIDFRASSQGAGFYVLFLDGQLIDATHGVSLIAPGSSAAQIEVGLLRDGKAVAGDLRDPHRRGKPDGDDWSRSLP